MELVLIVAITSLVATPAVVEAKPQTTFTVTLVTALNTFVIPFTVSIFVTTPDFCRVNVTCVVAAFTKLLIVESCLVNTTCVAPAFTLGV